MILVTGLSGSGKTSISNSMRVHYELEDDDINVITVHLDIFTGYFAKHDKYKQKLKECETIRCFIEDIIIKKYKGGTININWYKDNAKIHDDFLQYLSVKEARNKLYIVEGVQLFTVVSPKTISNILKNPNNELYIISKGFIECSINRVKRGFKNLINAIDNKDQIGLYIKNIFHYDLGFEHIKELKLFNKFLKEFKDKGRRYIEYE